jgi:LPPG:FO 2-phospho-L-lactate transferase
MSVTLLGGGVGSSRLAVPLAGALDEHALSIVANTGDDLWRYGLRICPDLDTNLYALSGLRDTERGWGVAGDSFRTMEQLRVLGDDAWFNLGDLDLATHLLRTGMLRDGFALSEVMAHLAEALRLGVELLPCTDDEVQTRVDTPDGEFSFQEYFVQRGATDPVNTVHYLGAESSRPAPGVLGAIEGAELVVLGPSNTITSLGPILAVPGIRQVLRSRRSADRPTVAVSPVVNGVPITAPGEAHRARCRDAMLASQGFPHRAAAVGELLADIAGTFVLDRTDHDEAPELRALGFEVIETDTIIADEHRGAALASVVLGCCR